MSKVIEASKVIEVRKLTTGYGRTVIVRDLDLEVAAGEVVALLGPNGAGKTTTLLTIGGELPTMGGQVLLHGRASGEPTHRRARAGLSFVTESRSVFARLTVRENLRVGRADLSAVLDLFPELEPHLDKKAGLLSGGEQQMLTLGRALARRPRILLADELSLGLAPLVVDRLLLAVRQAADQHDLAVLLVEQHVRKVIDIADRAYVMRRGRIEMQGTAEELRGRVAEIQAAYLSTATAP